jgi:4-diphosphocytidyl-2-C-methyl-D-erythritol kinase
VLVNPGVSVPTKDVFAKLAAPLLPSAGANAPRDVDPAALGATRNDLEPPAIALQPVIADVLAALRASDKCSLARMSGSGATCFALFASDAAATAVANALSGKYPRWWVRATTLGP